jgi:hypothetical protein
MTPPPRVRRNGRDRRLGWGGWLGIGIIALVLVVIVWLLRTPVPSSFAPEPEAKREELAPLGAYELFFGDARAEGLQREVRYLARRNELEDDARTAIEALIAGSLDGGISPWPAATALEDLFVSTGGVVYVNFDGGVRAAAPAGDYIEWLLAASLTRTLCANFPELRGVRILIDGESSGRLIRRMPLDGTLTAPMFMEAP